VDAVAVMASLALCIVLNGQRGVGVRTTLLIAAAIIPASIAGARLLNALEYGARWGVIGAEFARNAGSSIYGALVVCFLLVVAATRALHLSTLSFLDAGAPAVALGEALSRIGCFCAGCCYGEAWSGPWGVVFPGDSFAAQDQRIRGVLTSTMTHSLSVHPVQLYGTILMSLLTWALVRQYRRRPRPGTVFFLLLIGYGTYRLALAPFRVDALDSMKLFSLAFIVVGAAGWLWMRPARPAV
jgi:phosphatidylglycerol---prolipoprotein diacylglyceryl transferase